MELLVRRYGYPVNGAAGIVGNLIAESRVMPNRIEGSADGHPDARAPTSPAGCATSRPTRFATATSAGAPGPPARRRPRPVDHADRRAGLFRHAFRGRQLGSAILSDLDAQVDYLVTELRRDYRAVDATLRSPGVTVDQAVRRGLLRFERPAAVLNRPLSDPAVQQVARPPQGARRPGAAQAVLRQPVAPLSRVGPSSGHRTDVVRIAQR